MADSKISFDIISRWLVGSSKIKKFALDNISFASETRPLSPPLISRIRLNTSSSVNKNASRILDLKNETILNYIGNYDYYLEKKEVQELAAFGTATQDRAGNSAEKGNVIVSDGTGEKNGTEQISGGGKRS